jgi:hypothetical protein
MAFTDTAIRNAKPADKPTKLTDGGGLSPPTKTLRPAVVERRA